jgi:chromosome partitioning protein
MLKVYISSNTNRPIFSKPKYNSLMLVTVASYKGGVGKTVTAVHLAAFLHSRNSSTILIDGDPNRSATRWTRRGHLPFDVVDERQGIRAARQYEHVVIDTQARPSEEDLVALAKGCDLLILPVTPDRMALEAMLDTRDVLLKLRADNHRVLLTIVPPLPSRDGDAAREQLARHEIPLFASQVTRAACFQKAADRGIPISEIVDARAARGWAEYQAVGREVLGEPENQ